MQFKFFEMVYFYFFANATILNYFLKLRLFMISENLFMRYSQKVHYREKTVYPIGGPNLPGQIQLKMTYRSKEANHRKDS